MEKQGARYILVDQSSAKDFLHQERIQSKDVVSSLRRSVVIKRVEPFKMNDIDEEDIEIAKWAFNSHSWVEEVAGYFTCKWCGRKHANTMAIMRGYPLCPENSYIKNYVMQAVKEV